MLAGTLISSFFIFFFLHLPVPTHSSCLALASYYITQGSTLSYIASLFNIPSSSIDSNILPYNPAVTNKDIIISGTRILIPFSCPSSPPALLLYTVLSGNTYDSIANAYANLTTSAGLGRVNPSYPANRIPDGVVVNVPVDCFCGDRKVDRRFGLFATYPLRSGETLASVATEMEFVDRELLRRFNPGVDFAAGKGIVFVPAKDPNGSYLPLKPSGISGGAIAGISVAAVVLLLLVVCFVVVVCRRRRAKKARLLATNAEMHPLSDRHDAFRSTRTGGVSSFTGISVDKSVEFSYEELAKATDDFSMASKIGSGGFGDVYYAELRGEKTAIKKMVMESSREFLAELKVLTHVHHLNLVRLIGYCTEGALFLIYEYIENGDLSQHLHGSGRQPLSWASRVQIALDSARGLEYIHEHTVPVYIHRDIKSPNILLDKKFHAKVADFGLAKLTEVGTSTQTRLVGTFGYMPPEYANLGDVSPKVDVYAFGVVLYELISAKQAIVRTNASITETKGLVALFDDVLNLPDAKEHLLKLVDPRLGDNYPIDVAYKMAQIGKACTEENPQLRPSMRSVVVSLMTLSSSTEEWDPRPLYENQAVSNLMSGR